MDILLLLLLYIRLNNKNMQILLVLNRDDNTVLLKKSVRRLQSVTYLVMADIIFKT